MSAEPRSSYQNFPETGAATIRRLHPGSTAPSPEEAEGNESGQDDGIETEAASQAPPAARSRTGLADKKVLLAGGAACALVVALGVWSLRPASRPVQPVGQEVGIVASPLTPAAQPHPRPATQPAPVVVRPSSSAASPSPVKPPVALQAQPGNDLDAMLAAGPHGKAADHANPPSTPATSPTEAVETPEKPAPTSSAPAITPQNAADAASHLVAAPLAPKDQVDVLQLVTMEASLVQQSRSEIAALRTELQRDHEAATQHDADILRRLAMLEAKKAVADAADVQTSAREDAADQAKRALAAAMARPSTDPASSSASPTPSTAQPATTQPAPAPVRNWVPHYRIVSASPLLGMVQDDNAPAGEPSQLEVEPGTNLRGYGVVKSISQSGTNWVIRTDHGLIN
ncbi:hypothetical protein J2D73_10200 [Acetobacter sacchari]|uniref:Uncharacterized protein n=1 Tax=Acetobacter sacchari TaxID=2661687 RepID=A0ABS3LW81_9PROT|nr:hypothetical protein [Acetobacter sacchari]MBO1360169.1 hypothetical protein [Acetobacter sacchari]